MIPKTLLAAITLAMGTTSFAQDVRVNQFLPDYQVLDGITTDGSTIRILWSSEEFCPQAWGEVTRQMDLAGRFLTPDKPAQKTCLNPAAWADIAMLADGAFLVVRSTNDNKVIVQRYGPDGTPWNPELLLKAKGTRRVEGVRVVAHPDLKWVVEWFIVAPQGTGVWARIVDEDGTRHPLVALPSALTSEQFAANIGVFDSGEIIAVWGRADTTYPLQDVVERRFDRNLTPLGPETEVTEAPIRNPGQDQIGLGVRGSKYLVAWVQDLVDSDIHARFGDQGFGPVGSTFVVNSTGSGYVLEPYCAIDDQGRSVVVFDFWGADGFSDGVYARRYDATGVAMAPEFRVNMTTFDVQRPDGVAMLASGDFVVGFDSQTGDDWSSDAFFRRFFFPVSLVVGAGPGPGNPPRVETRRPDGEPGGVAIIPYGTGGYGAEVGTGDTNGDGFSEILTGPGPSAAFGPHVRSFRGDATPVSKVSYYAYGTLRYGVKPASGDLDNDGYDEILTAAGPGSVFGPHIRGWNYDGSKVSPMPGVSFFAFRTLRYGANVAGGDLTGDGYDDIYAGPGPGPVFGSQLRGFEVNGGAVSAMAKVNEILFPGSFYGLTVGAVDSYADGKGQYGTTWNEILAARGPGPGNRAEFSVWNWTGLGIYQKHLVDAGYGTMYGLRMVGGDVDAGDTEEIVTVPGPDPSAPARVRCFEFNPRLGKNPDPEKIELIGSDDFDAFTGLAYGATIAVGAFP